MATELEDHNDGQKDGADATFLDSLVVELNPFLSRAYKQGFRHADQQQAKRKVEEKQQEAEQQEVDRRSKSSRPQSPDESEEEAMPWFLKLIIAFYVMVFSGIFLLLRWMIQRPWRVAVALLIMGGIAIISWQAQQETTMQQSGAPTPASRPAAADATVKREGVDWSAKPADQSTEDVPRDRDSPLVTPIEFPNECPGEGGCQFGPWTAKSELIIYQERSIKSPVMLRLLKGDTITGVSAVLVVKALGECITKLEADAMRVVDNRLEDVKLPPSVVLPLCFYGGEGNVMVQYQGDFLSACCEDNQIECTKAPDTELWLQVRSGSGHLGWTNQREELGGTSQYD